MGSDAEVVVFGPDCERLADWAVAEIDRLESSWSRFRPESDLCQLNRSAGRSTIVSTTLWTALEAAAQAWAETAGRFDPTVLAALVSLGYDRTFADVATDPGAAVRSAPVPGFGQVDLDPTTRSVSLPVGVGLDLGGIGKGLAADLVVDGLVAQGARSVAVSMGGDIRVAGEGPHVDGSWLIPVMRPTDDALLGTFPLVDEALVQSTISLRSWTAGGRRLHHLIDPRSGWPADTGVMAVVVTGPTAARSEAFAKAALIAGPVAGPAMLDEADLDGWFIAGDGSVSGTHRVAADLTAGLPAGPPAGPSTDLTSSVLAGSELS
jgi:thiamine biosynthesis lipoprotein